MVCNVAVAQDVVVTSEDGKAEMVEEMTNVFHVGQIADRHRPL